MHAFKYQFKILIKNKSLVFWTLLFPIILGGLFKMAFSDLMSSETLKDFNIAVVEKQENSGFKSVLKQLDAKKKDGFMNIKYVDEAKAKKLLSKEKIVGYYYIDDTITCYVDGVGTDQSLMGEIANSYLATTSTVNNVVKVNPQAVINDGIEKTLKSLQKENFKEKKFSDVDMSVIYFYTLIALSCINGGTWAIKVASLTEANLSTKGARLNVAPTSKAVNLFGGLLAAFIIHYTCSVLIFGYVMYGLNIDFGNQVGYILLLMAAGSFCGLGLGNVIANILKAKESTKVSVFTTTTMVLSFFAGMMGSQSIKYMLQTDFPILANINPVNLITDALYSLYYYTDNVRYFNNLIYLVIMGGVFLVISLIFSRRKQYDSI